MPTKDKGRVEVEKSFGSVTLVRFVYFLSVGSNEPVIIPVIINQHPTILVTIKFYGHC